ncbi:hypothetical protein GCM10022222_05160 [Amycolatopsis ultiminotia]|uniref:FAD dependent oxidoreductase domain-containing protein n=1 Tax=Amycolatopsis ultiminotia TaxID=543629 RepID=A0ABP6V178_9PSEU
MRRDADVIVVGAGCTGLSVAWHLAARGVEVLVLDRQPEPEAEQGTIGFLVADGDLAPHRGALRSLRLWRELEATAGIEVLTRTGGIVHGDSAELDLLAWVADAAGSPGRWLPPEEAVERWPGIRYGSRIFFHPLGGRLDTAAAAAALQRLSRRADGVVLRAGEQVTAISARGEDGVEVRSESRGYCARRVVVAAGVASARLADGFLSLPPLFSAREESVFFAPVREGLPWPVVRHVLGETECAIGGFPAAVRGAPAARGGVAARFETADPDDAGRSARDRALCRYVRDHLPGLDAAPEPSAGRGYTFARKPVFARSGPVVAAAGFSGDQFALLPAVGRAVAELSITSDPHPTGLAS